MSRTDRDPISPPSHPGMQLDSEFLEFVASEFGRLMSEQHWNAPPLAQTLISIRRQATH